MSLMRQNHDVCVLVSNVPLSHAPSLARALVHEQLAACVNLLPGVQSFYIWEGEIVEDEEHTLLIKTSDPACQACIARLVELHPYTTPEVLRLRPEAVHALYADWVSSSVNPPTPPDEDAAP